MVPRETPTPAVSSRDAGAVPETKGRLVPIGRRFYAIPWRVRPDLSSGIELHRSRVGTWRGGLGLAYLLPVLSGAGASIASPYPVSTSRSSNRTGPFQASGSRTRAHAFAHGKSRVRPFRRTRPSLSWRDSLGHREYTIAERVLPRRGSNTRCATWMVSSPLVVGWPLHERTDDLRPFQWTASSVIRE